MLFELKRPKPALPNSYFWTWDHSTNWILDNPGVVNFGCYNRYLKRPDTFVEDYEKLTDLACGLGINGIVIWGFLRDSHGGVKNAKKVAEYAASRGVSIMPGVGTTWYGGPYYEGDHQYNLENFLRKNPSARAVGEDKWRSKDDYKEHAACPTNPLFKEWIAEGINWLFREFPIGGINLENGDFLVCKCQRCKEIRDGWPSDEPEFFFQQSLGYGPVLEYADKIEKEFGEKLITWATYTGFTPGKSSEDYDKTAYMNCDRPSVFDRLENQQITQWTLSGMISQKPLPLTLYLDNGAPDEVFNNKRWPKNVIPPSQRSVGLIHQGSQWTENRYEQVISVIKEGCLRAYRAGLEGVSIHGELSSINVTAALNYLAFSHFIHWPEDTLRDFGKKTLGEIFENESEGEKFAEILAYWDANLLTYEHINETKEIWNKLVSCATLGSREKITDSLLYRIRFWYWLRSMVAKYDKNEKEFGFRRPQNRHVANFF